MTSDDELVSNAVEGDSDALATLLKLVGRQVGQRIRVDPAWQAQFDAADVLQVTYMEAFLRIGQLENRTRDGLVAWLTRIAENNLRDAIKELQRARRPDPRRRLKPADPLRTAQAFLDQLCATTMTASGKAAVGEAIGLLEAAIERLPATYREVVKLYDLQALSPQEVAGAIARSVGAVHMLRRRAHHRLRELLGPATKFFTAGA